MKRLKPFLFALFLILIEVSLRAEITGLKKEYGVVGLSAAIIDHYFFITDEQLQSITSEKGGWAPIDYSALSSFLQKNKGAAKIIPGGSGVNVIKGMRQLGQKCAVIGKVGSGDMGEYYVQKMKDLGIIPLFEKGSLPTGQSVCLITPDGERTFRTYLGASHNLSDLLFDPEIFKRTRLIHIEGYQLLDPDLVIRILKLAKKAETMISMDLANVEIVRRNKEFIHNILDKYVDVLFCNEREAKELTGLLASEACDKLSTFCDVTVITMSERGSWARSGDEKVYMEALSVNTVDTTGAGDLYTSGFLHGYLQGESLRKCAWMGALISAQVVKQIGAEISQAIWEEIRSTILEEGKAFD